MALNRTQPSVSKLRDEEAMTNGNDLGRDALRRIANVWQIDGARVIWADDGSGLPAGTYGFDWWP
jgi:hypothetical protein